MEKQFISDNGTEIFYYPNRNTHSFCLSLYIKAGLLYEEKKDNGITHFLEHLFFRSINAHMDGEMHNELDRRGLYFNGETYKEFMRLYLIGAPCHFRAALDLLLNVFKPFSMPVEEVETEQQRVKAEIREADELKTLEYFGGTCVWKDSPLAETITGSRRNVGSFSRRRMEAYRKKVLVPDNFFFYLTGNVSSADLDYAREAVGALAFSGEPLCRENCAPVPIGFGQRGPDIAVKNSRDTIVQFSYDFFTSRYNYAEITLLYDLLFSGENSLIHQELSEKRGLIYSYSAVLEKYSNIGRLYFSYEVEPKKLYDSLRAVQAAVRELRGDLRERLSMVLPEYTDNGDMLYDDNENFNWNRAYETHIMADRSRSAEETRREFEAVKPERLREIAEEVLTAGNLVLTFKGDPKKIDRDRIREILHEEETKEGKA